MFGEAERLSKCDNVDVRKIKAMKARWTNHNDEQLGTLISNGLCNEATIPLSNELQTNFPISSKPFLI